MKDSFAACETLSTLPIMCTECRACISSMGSTPERITKSRIGISFDKDVVSALDEQVRLSPDLAADRSEIANVVVKDFFSRPFDHRAKTRELVTSNREGDIKL